MLEYFILRGLGTHLANQAKSKGYAGWPFVVILVISYILCAVTGAILGAVHMNDLGWFVGYLGGAVLASITSYAIVAILPHKGGYDEADERDYRRPSSSRRRSVRDDDDDRDRDRGRTQSPRRGRSVRDDDDDRDRDYR